MPGAQRRLTLGSGAGYPRQSEQAPRHDPPAAALAAESALGIACMPSDIAAAILYLLSSESRYVTGHTLAVDAGLTTAGSNPPPFFSQDAELLLHAGQRVPAGDD